MSTPTRRPAYREDTNKITELPAVLRIRHTSVGSFPRMTCAGECPRRLGLMTGAFLRFDASMGSMAIKYASVFEGDASRLMRAFNNLIANALDSMYDAKSQEPVKIEILEEGDFAIIKVIDTGIGIPSEKLDRIFEPRFTTKTHGLGLGLAMVKSIVEQSKGEVSVLSEEGKGATFTIKLLKARK